MKTAGKSEPNLTPAEFSAALEELGIGPSEFARLVNVHPDMARKWLRADHEGPTGPASYAARAMLQRRAEIVAAWLNGFDASGEGDNGEFTRRPRSAIVDEANEYADRLEAE